VASIYENIIKTMIHTFYEKSRHVEGLVDELSIDNNFPVPLINGNNQKLLKL